MSGGRGPLFFVKCVESRLDGEVRWEFLLHRLRRFVNVRG